MALAVVETVRQLAQTPRNPAADGAGLARGLGCEPGSPFRFSHHGLVGLQNPALRGIWIHAVSIGQ